MSLQTVPVGLRYILVAVLKLKGGSPASIYASASIVSAYPMQSYDIMFISVTNHQLKKNWCLDKRSPCPSYLFIADSKIAVTVRVLLGLQSPCHQEDSPPALISSAICRFTSLSLYVSDFYEEDTGIYEPEGLNLTPSCARYLRYIVKSRPW